jgi:hypothetical protein
MDGIMRSDRGVTDWRGCCHLVAILMVNFEAVFCHEKASVSEEPGACDTQYRQFRTPGFVRGLSGN